MDSIVRRTGDPRIPPSRQSAMRQIGPQDRCGDLGPDSVHASPAARREGPGPEVADSATHISGDGSHSAATQRAVELPHRAPSSPPVYATSPPAPNGATRTAPTACSTVALRSSPAPRRSPRPDGSAQMALTLGRFSTTRASRYARSARPASRFGLDGEQASGRRNDPALLHIPPFPAQGRQTPGFGCCPPFPRFVTEDGNATLRSALPVRSLLLQHDSRSTELPRKDARSAHSLVRPSRMPRPSFTKEAGRVLPYRT